MRDDERLNEWSIEPLRSELPESFDAMLVEARQDGHAFIERFHSRWQEGEERYLGESEGIFAAFENGRIVGVAAIGVDPYAGEARIGRLRHVFVLKAARRKGVAEALVRACLERGKGFDLIRLRSRNPEASGLYERLGFSQIDAKDATHAYCSRISRADP
jgi:GNAT superfamily N-acetyltransferase